MPEGGRSDVTVPRWSLRVEVVGLRWRWFGRRSSARFVDIRRWLLPLRSTLVPSTSRSCTSDEISVSSIVLRWSLSFARRLAEREIQERTVATKRRVLPDSP
jgi:hypothetical protein